MEKHTVSASLTDNTKYMNRALPVKKSFDIIERNLIIAVKIVPFILLMVSPRMKPC